MEKDKTSKQIQKAIYKIGTLEYNLKICNEKGVL